MHYLSHLQCGYCNKEFRADQIMNLCPECAKPLLVMYDLESVKRVWKKSDLKNRPKNMWRYDEMLPVLKPENRLCLGEGFTPLTHAKNLGTKIGFAELYIKDEGLNPTGSFKARGLGAAVAKAYEFGLTEFVMPTAGNAGAALTAYAAHIGGKAHVFLPKDSPKFIIKEIEVMGAEIEFVEGLISDAGAKAKVEGEKHGWFNMSTLKEPYRVEGKKTMGLELAEQFNWTLPDMIIYPTGGGTGIVGMWKAFDEMEQMGLIDSKRPKMVTVQPTGCQPIVRAFHQGDKFAEPWKDAHSFAAGIRVPGAIADYLILNALRESKGSAIAVEDSEIRDAMYKMAKTEGTMVAPEAAATVAAAEKLRESNFIDKKDKVVLFITGSGLTTPYDW
ncbi:MAG: threonine synthase [Candidatus Heimdallarchaeota archaeon]|nr:threonine synthase [Candidatus Heimdallarchaeota archaeon]